MLKWLAFAAIVAIVLGTAFIIIEALFPLNTTRADKNDKT